MNVFSDFKRDFFKILMAPSCYPHLAAAAI